MTPKEKAEYLYDIHLSLLPVILGPIVRHELAKQMAIITAKEIIRHKEGYSYCTHEKKVLKELKTN